MPSQQNWKSIVLVSNKLFYVFIIFYVLSHDFWSKLIIIVAFNNHIILLLYEENIFI